VNAFSRGAKRVALIAVAAAVLAIPAPAAADKVDDLLFDLQMVPLDGKPAAPFTLPALDGKRVSLSDFKGQVVLLYFWATW
jgi:cytochrome oxidase Cu insertion factor (SCO1/SenC/PrrC family)